jgi:molybdate transport system substrate-binding protein
MQSIFMKKLAVGISAACLLACASDVHAGTITIYAASNLQQDLLPQLMSDYQTYVDPTANFNVTYGATATLESTIISLGNSGSGQADLFLAANTAAPNDLYTNYNSLVTGSPFNYAQGYLVLWSNSSSDVSGGLPNPFNTNFVIANPTTAPYGTAAQQLMAGAPWNYTSPIPGGYVYTSTDIYSTYTAIANQTYAYGFVAQSLVCTYDGTNYYFSGNSYYWYSSGYTPLVQAGIVINRTGQDTDLTNSFVSFLSSAQGLADIQSYCYSTPGYDIKKAVMMKPKSKLLLPEQAKHPLFPVHVVQHLPPVHSPIH